MVQLGGFTWKHGVLGAAILIGAAVAGFVMQPEAGPAGFGVSWSTRDRSVANASETVDGGTATFDVPIARPNVTRVQVSVTVAVDADHTSEDPVTVRLQAPDGNVSWANASVSAGDAARVNATRTVAETPTVHEIVADNASAAKAELAKNHTSTAAQGTWTVAVTVDHGGTPADHRIDVDAQIRFYEVEILPA